jgi:hypothetical protein
MERRISAWAETAFEREIRLVSDCPEGGRNEQLNKSSHALFQIVAGGFLDANAVYRALVQAAHDNGSVQDDGEKAVRATIQSGRRAGLSQPRKAPEGEDDNDARFENLARAGVKFSASGTEFEPVRPLFRKVAAALPFPMDALGPLQPAAEAIQRLTQAPAAICAQAVLGAATVAAQAHRDIELPGGGRKPIVGFFASIAESGERKSTVDKIALAAVYEVEAAWGQGYENEIALFKSDYGAWKAATEDAKKKAKGENKRAAIRDALNLIGPEPKEPPSPMMLVDDFSPEALVIHLQKGRSSAGIFTAEGGTLVGGHAFNDEKMMQTSSLLNVLWDATPIRRTRITTGTAFLRGRRCSSHIMMQSVVADRLLGTSLLDGIGMLARMLTVAPESTIGTRIFREPEGRDDEALVAYNAKLRHLLTMDPRVMENAPDVLDPWLMALSIEAKEVWVAFFNETEVNSGAEGQFCPIVAFSAKMAEHAGRLAALLSFYDDPTSIEVSKYHMECGINLSRHYAAELMRLKGGAAVGLDLKLADLVLKWMQGQGGDIFCLTDIYQFGPTAIRTAAAARQAMQTLEDHGHVRLLPAGTEVDGKKRKEAWKLKS